MTARSIQHALVLLALVTAAVALDATPAHAQPAMALGKPLPDGTLASGTVSVRVVAGTPTQAVIGTDVTLMVNGTPRMARTDSAGRAMFPGIAPGASVVAKVADAEGKEITSEAFEVPTAGGVRVMLSTKPFAGMAAMPPAGHGAQGMPEARQMSGQPRLDREVPAGTYQIRVTYNNLTMASGKSVDREPPVGETVTLVGYNADNGVDVRRANVDANGHAMFEELDLSGGTVYYALARLPRAGGVDRLMASPAPFNGQIGAKLILSGDKRTATTSPIDELAGGRTLPPGKVRVVLDGIPGALSEISLVDAAKATVIAKGKAAVVPPDPSNVEGGARFEPLSDLPAGTLAVFVHGGPGGSDQPLPEIPLRVVPVPDDAGGGTAADQGTAEGLTTKTGPDGTVRVAVAPDKPHKVVFTINGKNIWSDPVNLAQTGGKLDLVVRWEAQGRPEVTFDVPFDAGHVLYAETTQRDQLTNKDQLYRTQPFQTIETAGTNISIPILPRVMFRFSWSSFVEDEWFGVGGLFAIDNNSYMPYRASADGMIIPLPRDHKGAVVGEEFQGEVAVAQGEGLRILRPLPPGRTQFEARFSLKAEDGEVDWALDLPLGTFQSMMQIRQTPAMKVNLPGNVTGETRTTTSGQKVYVIDEIMIKPNQSMVMTITGLPRHASWKKWIPRFIGVLAVGMILGGLLFALLRKPGSADETALRCEILMKELVELEKSGKDPKRRDQVLAELEKIWA